MKQEEKYMQGQGITGDTLADTTKEVMLANMKNDVTAYERSLKRALADKENYVEQLEIDKKLWDILRKPGSLKRLEPLYQYETDPEWAELQHKKQLFKIRMDEATAAQTVEGLDNQIKTIEEALKDTKERLAKFSEEKEDE